jgi:hypothetical protein
VIRIGLFLQKKGGGGSIEVWCSHIHFRFPLYFVIKLYCKYDRTNKMHHFVLVYID